MQIELKNNLLITPKRLKGEGRKITFILSFIIGLLPTHVHSQTIQVGAEDTAAYFPLLRKKNIAVVANQTSRVFDMHLVDVLLNFNFSVRKVFSPEHGFRGVGDAGEKIEDQRDRKTGLPIKSLYGSSKKPSVRDLNGIDVVVFDIQDVGVRFYTYISTMHYVMEACAENNVQFIVLDRPNPNGFYIDGPVLDPKFKSFVGLHPIPIVHGLTVAELAVMINNEGWLENGVKCNLKVIECANYSHKDRYTLPVAPSPNLPNQRAIYLYPSLGLFEGTEISVGRGTDFPFQQIGAPELQAGENYFVPKPNMGSKYPPYLGEKCRGFDLRNHPIAVPSDTQGVYINWLKVTYNHYKGNQPYFKKNGFFNLLAGTNQLQSQIMLGTDLKAIQESWKEDLDRYSKLRKRYLLYEDFN